MSDIATELAERAAKRLWNRPATETKFGQGELRSDYIRAVSDIIADVYQCVPDLLAACEAALNHPPIRACYADEMLAIRQQIEAAIAKARGQ